MQWHADAITIRNGRNYADYLKALYYLDIIVTLEGGDNLNNAIDDDWRIVINLIKHRLRIKGFRNEYPMYINEIFRAYT